jgi:osmotically inducible protein OsmC
MPARTASARWEGGLRDGGGTVRLGSGAYEGPYSFASRFEDGTGTNPEELIGAAHAGCFSMALTLGLEQAGHPPTSVETTARVHLERSESGFEITSIDLDCTATVPGIDDTTFQAQAATAKVGCPVSKALAGTEINLEARLAGG